MSQTAQKIEPTSMLDQSTRKLPSVGKNDKFFIFINGGTFRMLLHIILKGINTFGNSMTPD